jgi:uncharacterized alpha-E superfamily protein
LRRNGCEVLQWAKQSVAFFIGISHDQCRRNDTWPDNDIGRNAAGTLE